MTTTPIEKILPREALQHIRPRSAATQVEDAKRELSQTKAQLHVESTHHKQTREERDMLARQLQKMSRSHTDARIILTKALTVLKGYREHIDARAVYKDIRRFFDLRDGDE